MSININVHGATTILADMDQCRREETQRRKLIRLSQVREQAKCLAQMTRLKYADEQRRQIELIDQIKANEIRAWKARHCLKSPHRLKSRVGEAHLAAERERLEECQRHKLANCQRRVAEERGRAALARMHERALKKQMEGRNGCGASSRDSRGKSPGRGKSPCAPKARDPCATTPKAGGRGGILKRKKHDCVTKKTSVAAGTQVGPSMLGVCVDAETGVGEEGSSEGSSTSANAAAVAAAGAAAAARASGMADDSCDDEEELADSSLEIEMRAKQLSQPLVLANATQQQFVAPGSDEGMRELRPGEPPPNWFFTAEEDQAAALNEPLTGPGSAWEAGLRSGVPDGRTGQAYEDGAGAGSDGAGGTGAGAGGAGSRAGGTAGTGGTAGSGGAAGTGGASGSRAGGTAGGSSGKSKSTTFRTAIPGSGTQPFVPQFQKPGATGGTPAGSAGASAGGRVQYYDHANRFSKEYVADKGLVRSTTGGSKELNAMEQAAAELERVASVRAEAARKEREAAHRGRQAMDVEQARRDQELMKDQLEEFRQRPDYAGVFGTQQNPNYTEDRLQQMAAERDRQMQNVFGPSAGGSAGGTGADGSAVTGRRSGKQPDTDSTELLREYIQRRMADMDGRIHDAMDDMSPEKRAKLKALLDQINDQRDQLLNQMQPLVDASSYGYRGSKGSSKSPMTGEQLGKLKRLLSDVNTKRDQVTGELQRLAAESLAEDMDVAAPTSPQQRRPTRSDRVIERTQITSSKSPGQRSIVAHRSRERESITRHSGGDVLAGGSGGGSARSGGSRDRGAGGQAESPRTARLSAMLDQVDAQRDYLLNELQAPRDDRQRSTNFEVGATAAADRAPAEVDDQDLMSTPGQAKLRQQLKQVDAARGQLAADLQKLAKEKSSASTHQARKSVEQRTARAQSLLAKKDAQRELLMDQLQPGAATAKLRVAGTAIKAFGKLARAVKAMGPRAGQRTDLLQPEGAAPAGVGGTQLQSRIASIDGQRDQLQAELKQLSREKSAATTPAARQAVAAKIARTQSQLAQVDRQRSELAEQMPAAGAASGIGHPSQLQSRIASIDSQRDELHRELQQLSREKSAATTPAARQAVAAKIARAQLTLSQKDLRRDELADQLAAASTDVASTVPHHLPADAQQQLAHIDAERSRLRTDLQQLSRAQSTASTAEQRKAAAEQAAVKQSNLAKMDLQRELLLEQMRPSDRSGSRAASVGQLSTAQTTQLMQRLNQIDAMRQPLVSELQELSRQTVSGTTTSSQATVIAAKTARVQSELASLGAEREKIVDTLQGSGAAVAGPAGSAAQVQSQIEVIDDQRDELLAELKQLTHDKAGATSPAARQQIADRMAKTQSLLAQKDAQREQLAEQLPSSDYRGTTSGSGQLSAAGERKARAHLDQIDGERAQLEAQLKQLSREQSTASTPAARKQIADRVAKTQSMLSQKEAQREVLIEQLQPSASQFTLPPSQRNAASDAAVIRQNLAQINAQREPLMVELQKLAQSKSTASTSKQREAIAEQTAKVHASLAKIDAQHEMLVEQLQSSATGPVGVSAGRQSRASVRRPSVVEETRMRSQLGEVNGQRDQLQANLKQLSRDKSAAKSSAERQAIGDRIERMQSQLASKDAQREQLLDRMQATSPRRLSLTGQTNARAQIDQVNVERAELRDELKQLEREKSSATTMAQRQAIADRTTRTQSLLDKANARHEQLLDEMQPPSPNRRPATERASANAQARTRSKIDQINGERDQMRAQLKQLSREQSAAKTSGERQAVTEKIDQMQSQLASKDQQHDQLVDQLQADSGPSGRRLSVAGQTRVRSQLDQINKQRDELRDDLEQLSREKDAATSTGQRQAIADKMERKQTQLATKDTQRDRLLDQLQPSSPARQTSGDRDQARTRSQLAQVNAQRDEMRAELQQLARAQSMASTSGERQAIADKMDRMKSQLATKEMHRDRLQEQLRPTSAHASAATSRLSNAGQTMMRSNLTQVDDERKALRAELKQLSREKSAATTKEARAQVDKRIAHKQAALASKDAQHNKLTDQLRSSRSAPGVDRASAGDLAQMRTQLNRLNEERDALRDELQQLAADKAEATTSRDRQAITDQMAPLQAMLASKDQQRDALREQMQQRAAVSSGAVSAGGTRSPGFNAADTARIMRRIDEVNAQREPMLEELRQLERQKSRASTEDARQAVAAQEAGVKHELRRLDAQHELLLEQLQPTAEGFGTPGADERSRRRSLAQLEQIEADRQPLLAELKQLSREKSGARSSAARQTIASRMQRVHGSLADMDVQRLQLADALQPQHAGSSGVQFAGAAAAAAADACIPRRRSAVSQARMKQRLSTINCEREPLIAELEQLQRQKGAAKSSKERLALAARMHAIEAQLLEIDAEREELLDGLPTSAETTSPSYRMTSAERAATDALIAQGVARAVDNMTEEKAAHLGDFLQGMNRQHGKVANAMAGLPERASRLTSMRGSRAVATGRGPAGRISMALNNSDVIVLDDDDDFRPVTGGRHSRARARSYDRAHAHDKENRGDSEGASSVDGRRTAIEQREKIVCRKEREIEQKMRALRAAEKAKGAGDTADADCEPVKITIQVNGGTAFEKIIRPKGTRTAASSARAPRKQPTAAANAAAVPCTTVPLADRPKSVYPKTPVKCPPSLDDCSTSTTYQQMPPRISTALEKSICNPHSALGQYIVQLLGMSKTCVDQLGAKIGGYLSDVETPGSSVINVCGNVDEEDSEMDKLQSFVSNNRSFIAQVERSMQGGCQTGGAGIPAGASDAEQMKAVERLWLATMAEQEQQMQRMREEKKQLKRVLHEKKLLCDVGTATRDKPILKNCPPPPAASQRTKVVCEEQQSLTANCNARIADLNDKLEQVRRERQRLVESTFSSMGSSTMRETNSVEYVEVVSSRRGGSKNGSQNSSRDADLVSLNDDGKRPAASAAPIGQSRDSGINVVSRPQTAASELATSPDQRGSSASDQRLSPASSPAKRISARPPLSQNRFGPHVDELELPHQLSTIIEVDTPAATSRTAMNTSGGCAGAVNLADMRRILCSAINASAEDRLLIQGFADGQQSLMERSALSSIVPQGIQPFGNYSRYDQSAAGGADESNNTSNTSRIKIKRFVSHDEFDDGEVETTKRLEASFETKCGDEAENQDPDQEADDGSSTDSFPDVEAELKRRNLLLRPFQTYSSSSSQIDGDCSQFRTSAGANHPEFFSSSATATTTSDNLEAEMQRMGLQWAGSMLRKQQNKKSLESTTSTTTDGDLSARQQKVPSIKVTNASLVEGAQGANLARPSVASSSRGAGSGPPLNLKEFLTHELLKRSANLSSTSAATSSTPQDGGDTTMASHFLRSLLNTTTASDRSSSVAGAGAGAGRVAKCGQNTSAEVAGAGGVGQRTSTPNRTGVEMSGVETSQSQRSKSHGQLFSGESGMSSVRGEKECD